MTCRLEGCCDECAGHGGLPTDLLTGFLVLVNQVDSGFESTNHILDDGFVCAYQAVACLLIEPCNHCSTQGIDHMIADLESTPVVILGESMVMGQLESCGGMFIIAMFGPSAIGGCSSHNLTISLMKATMALTGTLLPKEAVVEQTMPLNLHFLFCTPTD